MYVCPRINGEWANNRRTELPYFRSFLGLSKVPTCPCGLWRARNTLSTYLIFEKWELQFFPSLKKKNEMDLKIGSHTQPSWPRTNPKERYGSRRESLVFPDRTVSGVSIAPQAKKGRQVKTARCGPVQAILLGIRTNPFTLSENSLSFRPGVMASEWGISVTSPWSLLPVC